MDWPVVAAIAIAVGFLVLLRMLAGRRVLAGEGRFVWLVFGPTLLVGAAPLWVAAVLFPTQPMFAVFVAIFGFVYLGLRVWLLMRMSRGVSSAAPGEDRVDALLSPFADYMAATMGLLLIGGLVALVVLLIWGVTQAGH
jgi:hypothetical protein